VIDTSLAERQRAGDAAPSGPLPGACKYHPEKMTRLRCNVCGEPICPRCARRRSAGYSCDDCIQELAGKFYNGNWRDYVLAVAIALPLSLVAGAVFTLMVGTVGYYGVFITLVGAPMAGGFLAEGGALGGTQAPLAPPGAPGGRLPGAGRYPARRAGAVVGGWRGAGGRRGLALHRGRHHFGPAVVKEAHSVQHTSAPADAGEVVVACGWWECNRLGTYRKVKMGACT
jgi:hypothetical protein